MADCLQASNVQEKTVPEGEKMVPPPCVSKAVLLLLCGRYISLLTTEETRGIIETRSSGHHSLEGGGGGIIANTPQNRSPRALLRIGRMPGLSRLGS